MSETSTEARRVCGEKKRSEEKKLRKDLWQSCATGTHKQTDRQVWQGGRGEKRVSIRPLLFGPRWAFVLALVGRSFRLASVVLFSCKPMGSVFFIMIGQREARERASKKRAAPAERPERENERRHLMGSGTLMMMIWSQTRTGTGTRTCGPSFGA